MCCKTGKSDKWLREHLIHLRGTAIITQLRIKGIATEKKLPLCCSRPVDFKECLHYYPFNERQWGPKEHWVLSLYGQKIKDK